MAKKMTARQIHTGEDVESAILRAGGRTRGAKGSHSVGYLTDDLGQEQAMAYYHGELSTGVRSKIVKWLILMGAITAVIFCAVAILALQMA